MRKVYFGAETEKAIRDYLKETDENTRQQIYIVRIQPAFRKLVENIINMPKFSFKKLGKFQSLQDEVMAHLYSNLGKFNPKRISKFTRKRVKAYSYFGTIAKNYLVQLSIAASKTDFLHEDHEGKEIDISTLPFLADNSFEDELEMKEFIHLLVSHFESKREAYTLEQKKVCDAITYFLNNSDRETVYNKKHFYLLMKELTGMNSKQLTVTLIEFKNDYKTIHGRYYNGLI